MERKGGAALRFKARKCKEKAKVTFRTKTSKSWTLQNRWGSQEQGRGGCGGGGGGYKQTNHITERIRETRTPAGDVDNQMKQFMEHDGVFNCGNGDFELAQQLNDSQLRQLHVEFVEIPTGDECDRVQKFIQQLQDVGRSRVCHNVLAPALSKLQPVERGTACVCVCGVQTRVLCLCAREMTGTNHASSIDPYGETVEVFD
jgi:hypothetical protein